MSIKFLLIFSYNGKQTDTLTTLRHAKFMESVTTSFTLKPQNLPPSERAIYFHALRVHLQIAQWTTLDLECLNPLNWGWRKTNDTLEPIKTDLDPAPAEMLNFIRCNCKTTSKNTCGSRLCSCFRSGLKSISACGDCQGEFCKNIFEVEHHNVEDDIDRNIFDIFEQ